MRSSCPSSSFSRLAVASFRYVFSHPALSPQGCRGCGSASRFTKATPGPARVVPKGGGGGLSSGLSFPPTSAGELRRIREELRRSPSEAHRVAVLSEVIKGGREGGKGAARTQFSLWRIARAADLDMATFAQFAQLLAQLRAPPDLPMLREIAELFVLRAAAASPSTAAHLLRALITLRYGDLERVVEALMRESLQPRINPSSSSPLSEVDKEGFPISAQVVVLGALLRVVLAPGADASLMPMANLLRERLECASLYTLPLSDIVFLVDSVGASIALGEQRGSSIFYKGKANSMWVSFAVGLWAILGDYDLVALSFIDVLTIAKNFKPLGDYRNSFESIIPKIYNRIQKHLECQSESIASTEDSLSMAEIEILVELAAAKNPALLGFVPPDDLDALRVQVLKLLETYFERCAADSEVSEGAEIVLLNTGARILEVFFIHSSLSDVTSLHDKDVDLKEHIPEFLLQFMLNAVRRATNEVCDQVPMAVHLVLRCFVSDPLYRVEVEALSARYVAYLTKRSRQNDDSLLHPFQLTCLLVDGLVEAHARALSLIVRNYLDRWGVDDVFYFLKYSCEVPGKATRGIMRDAAEVLIKYVPRASANQIALLMRYYGKAGVRHDKFCEAVSERLRVLAVADAFSLRQLSDTLGGFALVEYAATAPFVSAAPRVLGLLGNSLNSAGEVAQLLAAYSKMLIWNFKLIWGLTEKMVQLASDDGEGRGGVSLEHLVATQLALIRMDLQHPKLTGQLLERIFRMFLVEAPATRPELGYREALELLSVLSRLPEGFLRESVDAAYPRFPRCLEFLLTTLRGHLERLARDVEAVAEVLLSLARAGLAEDGLFQALSLRAIEQVPSASPRSMATLARAHALAGKANDELFALLADRAILHKNRIAAATIAELLAAFAAAGVRHDQLFIEMIARVRHVGLYGTPRDLRNVVQAYARVNLWHYKLFASLADRAVQLRAEFRPSCMVGMLEAYALVGMRYEKLFVEFARRVQTVSHLLNAADLATVAFSYASMKIGVETVFRSCAERAVEIVEQFNEADAIKLFRAFDEVEFEHEAFRAAFVPRFSAIMETSQATNEPVKDDDVLDTEKTPIINLETENK
ncbi:unnamed protein product [Phytomonas sp. Hart1]|nr:unnamed protein product [Phytomonas sp. Hart1]|eukprot:CCW69890.1 unnamed protein product [Phytomonas sp. isolate Hart1]